MIVKSRDYMLIVLVFVLIRRHKPTPIHDK
jgi:hypothetical protein